MRPISIVIAVCTYRRPGHLKRLLESLSALTYQRCAAPDVTVLVIDNDADGTAQSAVESARQTLNLPLRYIIETARGLASVRNAALEAGSTYDYLAFLDDDEFVVSEWLDELLWTADNTCADFVIGPVRPVYPEGCRTYLKASGLFEREEFPDRHAIATGNTGNALLKMASLNRRGIRFRSEFQHSGGEDTCFFADLHRAGGVGAFAANAIAYEPVSSDRLSIPWLLKRRFRFGTTEVKQEQMSSKHPFVVAIRFLVLGAARVGGAILFVMISFPVSRGRALRYACAGARGAGYMAGVLGYLAKEYR